MTGPTPAQIHKVTDLIRELARRYLLLESGLANELDDLRKSELQVLELIALYHADTVSAVAQKGQVPLSTASWLVNNLVEQNYLVRETDQTDRRIQRLKLAERGEKVLHFLEDAFSAMALQRLNAANPEQASALVHLSEEMLDQFEQEAELKHT